MTADGSDDGTEPAVNCISSGGLTVCSEKAEPNCGLVNGEPFCAESVPAGACAFVADGSVVCAEGTGAPPAPTEADGVTAAAADGEFSGTPAGGGGGGFEFYGSGTVGESGTAVEGQGAGPGGGGVGEGEEPGEEECSGESCEGELPSGGELEDVDSFGELTSVFLARVEAAPLIASIDGLGASMPAGECPAPSTTVDYLDGMTLELDVHCDLWPTLATVISAVMLAVYVFLGARIVLSA
jgi:hypothetical protein